MVVLSAGFGAFENLTPLPAGPLPSAFLAPSPRAERGKGVRFAESL